ncbi:MAG: flagellar basal body rod protein FlgB [Cyanobacteria bacterium P01_H01_bin.74]
MDLVTSLTNQVMEKALDGLSKRHRAITSNLANVDTPNYHRRNVKFETQLHQAAQTAKNQNLADQELILAKSNAVPLAMQSSNPLHFSPKVTLDSFNPEVSEVREYSSRLDGNSVDIEVEMAELARNTQRYLALSNLESRAVNSLRSVINGG